MEKIRVTHWISNHQSSGTCMKQQPINKLQFLSLPQSPQIIKKEKKKRKTICNNWIKRNWNIFLPKKKCKNNSFKVYKCINFRYIFICTIEWIIICIYDKCHKPEINFPLMFNLNGHHVFVEMTIFIPTRKKAYEEVTTSDKIYLLNNIHYPWRTKELFS